MPKEIKPPYLSVVRLEKALELVSNRNLTNVSTAIFQQYDFNFADAGLAVNALQFLGVVDDKGGPTSFMAKLRLRGEARKAVFAEMLKNSYKKLFAAVDNPTILPNEELMNEFILNYNLSPRVARSALPAFLKLAELAGLKEVGSTPTRSMRPRKERGAQIVSAKPTKGNSVASTEGLHAYPIVKGKMTIIIPEDIYLQAATDDGLNEAWRSVLKAAHKFADEYLKDETPDSGE